MGLIFDERSAEMYATWSRSSLGRAMDRLVEEAILRLLDPRPRERVLDVGCGEGNHLLFFGKLGLDITGIDASPAMVRKARERIGHRGAFHLGIAEDLPFEDNAFDIVILVHTLEFLDNPIQALNEAARVARRKVFVGVLNSLSLNCLRCKAQGLFHDSLLRHARFFHLWETKTLMRSALGDVPLEWRCARIPPGCMKGLGGVFSRHTVSNSWPFGTFLCLSAAMRYWVRTAKNPLHVGLDRSKNTVVTGVTMNPVKRVNGVPEDERSLSI